MKFITFCIYDVAKFAEVAQASDKNSKIPGQKMLANYICLGKAFDGIPLNHGVSITIREAESAEILGAAIYNVALTGATIWAVPVMEVPVGGSVAELKKAQK